MDAKIRFLTLNIGLKNNLAGLSDLIKVHKLNLIFLQEVRVSESQTEQLLGNDFKCRANIDSENVSKPGTAVIWRNSLAIDNVSVLATCRAQLVILGSCGLMNIYAPSGSDKFNERAEFFARYIF